MATIKKIYKSIFCHKCYLFCSTSNSGIIQYVIHQHRVKCKGRVDIDVFHDEIKNSEEGAKTFYG